MAEGESKRLPPGVVNLLRDLAIAFLLVAIVMAALFAYTRVWPPMVVVESESMQHDISQSSVGVIDTGDIVLVQNAPRAQDVTTYAAGRASGYATYGDFGDVIIFRVPGQEGRIPIIHRAILYLIWDDETGFDVPSLLELNSTLWESTSGEPTGLGAGDVITLRDVGFRSMDISVSMSRFVNRVPPAEDCPRPCGGYITKGDYNSGIDDYFVPQTHIVGRARGEVPWFGLLKLVFGGNLAWGSSDAPANSWTSLTVALVVLILGPLALDFTLSKLFSRKREGPFNPGPKPPKSE